PRHFHAERALGNRAPFSFNACSHAKSVFVARAIARGVLDRSGFVRGRIFDRRSLVFRFVLDRGSFVGRVGGNVLGDVLGIGGNVLGDILGVRLNVLRLILLRRLLAGGERGETEG